MTHRQFVEYDSYLMLKMSSITCKEIYNCYLKNNKS